MHSSVDFPVVQMEFTFSGATNLPPDTTTTSAPVPPAPSYFAAIQTNPINGVIYGAGDSPTAALNAAAGIPNLETVPCTSGAFAWICANGSGPNAALYVSKSGVSLA